jgi:HSP20 family protein
MLIRSENAMTSLVYYEPWSLTAQWHRQLNRMSAGSPEALQPAITNSTTWVPPVDLHEENDRFVVRADLPGVAMKDIEVSAENGALTIRCERVARERPESGDFEHIECATGTFVRRFTLPESAQVEAIKARYAEGVLEIEIPKQPRVEAKRIAVTVN